MSALHAATPYTDYKLAKLRREAEDARNRLRAAEEESQRERERLAVMQARPHILDPVNRAAAFDLARHARLTRGLNVVQVAQQVRADARAWCAHLDIDFELMMGSKHPEGYPRGWRKSSFRLVHRALLEQGYTPANIKDAFGL